jgi:prevent-host-death family protein
MRRLWAEEASRRFAELLDAVERTGTRFLIVRHGHPVAIIGPVHPCTGRAVKELLAAWSGDPTWGNELVELRSSLTT